MPTIRREVWISVVTAAASFSLGGYRVLSLAMKNELTAGALVGELLGALILAILASWIAQLALNRKGLVATAVAALTFAIAGLVYLPQGISMLTGILLAGSCQLLIFFYAATALKPRLAKALARKNRRLRK